MPRHSVGGNKKYLLAFGDIIILYFSLWLTLLVRYTGTVSSSLWLQHLWPFTVVFIFWLVIFYIDDLYDLNYSQGLANLFVRLIRGTIFSIIIASTFFYFATDKLFTIKPQRVLLIQVVIALILLYLWRIFFHRLARSPRISNGILFIGFNELAQEMIKKINNTPQLGFKIKAIITKDNIPEEYTSLVERREFSELKNICLEKKVNTIISVINPRENQELLKNLFECIPLKIEFYDIANFYEKIIGKIPVKIIQEIWFLENLTESSKNLYTKISRIFDIIAAILILVLTGPFLPFFALGVKLSSKGPIFFKQTRVGKDNQIFQIIKFRSMAMDAEKTGPQWSGENDPRITSLGKFMRKTRIDEIPQLINVIKGEMSLVGPRPERPEFVAELQKQIPFYNERLLIKPGLTGWAQVVGPAYGGSVEESLEKLQYDLYYIKNRSVGLDLSIYLRTIKTILTRRGR